jgi:hypothetical protein
MGYIGGELGKFAGSALGGAVGNYFGGSKGGDLGKNIGQHAGGILGGELIPFRTGGRIPGKRGAPKKILAHGQEYILPVGVSPTKSQKKAVAKRKARSRKSKK